MLPLRPVKLRSRASRRVWSIKTITVVGLCVVALTATCVFLFGKRSIFRETELTLGLVSAGLFVFLAIGLYRGVRVKRRDLPAVDVPNVSVGDMADALPDGLSSGLDLASGIDDLEGCAGAIVALILAVVVGIFLVALLWFLLNAGIVVWVFLLAATSSVFYLALRQVFAKSRVCRGRLGPSLGYALLYTVLYTGWLFALVMIAEGLFGESIPKS
jgi:hypothetical protein